MAANNLQEVVSQASKNYNSATKAYEQAQQTKQATNLMNTTVKDLASKYGFNYSRNYAAQQAQVAADEERAAYNASLRENSTNNANTNRQLKSDLVSSNAGIRNNYFQNFLQQNQNQTNTGLNAGLAAQQNIQLGMSQQAELADVYKANNDAKIAENLRFTNEQSRLKEALKLTNSKQKLNEESLYQQMMQQAYENINNERSFGLQLDQNSWSKSQDKIANQLALSQLDLSRINSEASLTGKYNGKTTADEAYRQAQFEWNKKQYGEDAAWRMYELEYNGELSKSQSQAQLDYYKSMGFSGGSGGGATSTGSSSYTNNYKTTQQAAKSKTFPTYQRHLQEAIAKGGVPESWASALTELVGRESSWNAGAKNPTSTAFGYGQFLKSTRQNYEQKMGLSYSDPANQLIMMAQYVKDRYGTPEAALAFWDKNKWY